MDNPGRSPCETFFLNATDSTGTSEAGAEDGLDFQSGLRPCEHFGRGNAGVFFAGVVLEKKHATCWGDFCLGSFLGDIWLGFQFLFDLFGGEIQRF